MSDKNIEKKVIQLMIKKSTKKYLFFVWDVTISQLRNKKKVIQLMIEKKWYSRNWASSGNNPYIFSLATNQQTEYNTPIENFVVPGGSWYKR